MADVDMKLVQQTPPPALPFPGSEYDRTYFDQFNSVLRLYFTRLSGAVNALLGSRGGQYLNTPYAAVQRTTDKTFTANTATQITFDTNDFLNGTENSGADGVKVNQSGIYNYQFSVQFANTDTSIHEAWIWLRVNGVDVPGTGSRFSVPNKHGGIDGYLIAIANFYVQLNTNDSVELWAAVDNVAVYMEAYPVQTSPFAMPSIPSVVATVSFVSAL